MNFGAVAGDDGSFRLMLIVALLYVSSPTATHALVKAAFSQGVRAEDPKVDHVA